MSRTGVLVALAGVLAAVYFLLFRPVAVSTEPLELPARPTPAPAPAPRTPGVWISRFKLVNQSHGGNRKTGGSFSSSAFKAEDGTALTATSERFPSEAGARESIEAMLRRADTIVERGTMCDSAGHVVGERALLLLPATGSNKNRSILIYRNGEEIISFQSASAKDVLDFEAAPPAAPVKPCQPPARP